MHDFIEISYRVRMIRKNESNQNYISSYNPYRNRQNKYQPTGALSNHTKIAHAQGILVKSYLVSEVTFAHGDTF